MLAGDTRLPGQRQRMLLLKAIAVARVSAFALLPRVPIPVGRCEEVQVTQAHVVGCITKEGP